MKKIALILIVPLLICGCSKDSTKKQKTKKTSSTQSIIEGMTGHTAVKSGKKAANKIKSVSAAQQKELDKVLGK